MSMPFTEFRCKACDTMWTSSSLWGLYIYNLEDGVELSLDRTLGWCNDCEGIQAVECIESVKEETEQLEQLQGQLTKERRNRFKNPFKYLFSHTIKSLKQEIRSAELRLRWLSNRKAPPRCLKCGSHDILDIPDWQYPNNKTKLGFKHPGCGGELYYQTSDVRLNIRTDKKVYDSEGLLMRAEPED